MECFGEHRPARSTVEARRSTIISSEEWKNIARNAV
jgi:hypothetical protein